MELPEDVQRDSPVRGIDGLVGLVQHHGEGVQGDMFHQQRVRQPVDFHQCLQFLLKAIQYVTYIATHTYIWSE